MKKILVPLCFLMMAANVSAQTVLEPEIFPAPDISANAARNFKDSKAKLASLDSLIATYPDIETARHHLPKAQFEFWEKNIDALEVEDHLMVGSMGCSWYCGGGPDSIYATSFLKPSGKLDYKPENAHDFSLRTAWVEGVKGNGTGQRLVYRFPKGSPPVTTVDIYNGYMKTEKTWRDNGRVKQLRVYINEKPAYLFNLRDTVALQRFQIGERQGIKRDLLLQFEIVSVYPGAKYEDVAISELIFDGTGVHCFVAGTSVLMADGVFSRPIETISAGDTVLSWNEATAVFEPAVVLETARVKHHNLVQYRFSDGSELVGTHDHPFRLSNGSWATLKAGERYLPGETVALLTPGSSVRAKNGPIQFLGASAYPGCQFTYTIVRLSKNRIFFAGGVAVAVEPDPEAKDF